MAILGGPNLADNTSIAIIMHVLGVEWPNMHHPTVPKPANLEIPSSSCSSSTEDNALEEGREKEKSTTHAPAPDVGDRQPLEIILREGNDGTPTRSCG